MTVANQPKYKSDTQLAQPSWLRCCQSGVGSKAQLSNMKGTMGTAELHTTKATGS